MNRLETLQDLPKGRIAVLFIDAVGSTRAAQALGDHGYESRLRDPLRGLLFRIVRENDGFVIQNNGDGHMIVFARVDKAVACAMTLQEDLVRDEIQAGGIGTAVKISIHHTVAELDPVVIRYRDALTTELELDPEADESRFIVNALSYDGSNDLNLAARVGAAALAGQTLLTEAAHQTYKGRSGLTEKPWPGRYLKGFAEPQNVYELIPEGQASKGEPGTAFLPDFYVGEKSAYFEREDVQDEIWRHIKGDRTQGIVHGARQLVLIHGEGGLGKTRVAMKLCARLASYFTHGVRGARFGDVRPQDVADDGTKLLLFGQRLAEMNGLEWKPIADGLASTGTSDLPRRLAEIMVGRLAALDRLLFLDNYEIVACDATNRVLGHLVYQSRNLMVLVTSRWKEILDIAEPVPMEVMATEIARNFFCDRANLMPKVLTQASVEQIDGITRRCCHIPLYIELVAHWVRNRKRTLMEVAADLPKRFPEVRADGLSEAGRHDSRTACFGYSYDLLGTGASGDQARQVYRALGLVSGAIARSDVEALIGKTGLVDALDLLVDSHMVQSDVSGASTLYSMHSLGREDARSRLDERGETDELRGRWYRHLTERLGYYGPKARGEGFETAREWIGRHETDVTEMTDFFASKGVVPDEVVWGLSRLRSYVLATASSLALATLRIASDASEKRTLGAATLEFTLGEVEFRAGDLPAATGRYEAARETYRQAGNPLGEANCLVGLADLAFHAGDLPAATDLYEAGRETYRQAGNPLGEANCHLGLADLAFHAGDLPAATDLYEAALEAHRRAGSLLGEANCLRGLGQLAFHAGDLPAATDLYEAALEAHRRIGNPSGEADCLVCLGGLAFRAGDLPSAVAHYETAREFYQSVGDPHGEAHCLLGLGEVDLRAGDLPAATARYEEAREQYQRVGAPQGEANCLLGLGEVALRAGDLRAATARYETARELYRQMGDDPEGMAHCLLGLGHVALCAGDLPTATARYEAVQETYRQVGDPHGEAHCLLGLGEAAFRAGDLSAAARYEEAGALYRQVGDPHGEANCLRGLGQVHVEQGEIDAATAAFLRSAELYRRIARLEDAGRAYWTVWALNGRPPESPLRESARQAWTTIGRYDLLALLEEEPPQEGEPAP